jgi:O-antigen/teichoic acid export membrane protein
MSVGVALASMLNVLITARYLGPAGRGQLALVMSIATVTSTLAGLSLDQATVNMGSVHPGARAALATNALLFSALLGLGAAGLLALLTLIAPAITGHLPAALMWLTVASIPFLVARPYLGALVEADYRFTVSNASRLIAPLSAIVVNLLLAAMGALTVISASVTWVAGQLLGLVLIMLFLWLRSTGFGRADVDLARRTFRFGVKAHVGRALNAANYRLDQWLLGVLATRRELGLYSVAVACSEVLFLLPTTLAKVQRPDLARATRAVAARKAAAVFRAAVVLMIPAAAALVIAAPVLSAALFGPSFNGAIDDLRILAAGAFGVTAVKLLGDALTAQRRPLLSSVAVGFGCVFTVALDLVLIPRLAGLGAAIASTIAYSAGGLMAAGLFLRTLGGGPRDLWPRPADVAKVARVARRIARGSRRSRGDRQRAA